MPTPESDQSPTSEHPPSRFEPAPPSSLLTGVTTQVCRLIDPEDQSPERIGPYRVVKRLGEGGMGVVWLCTRDDGTISGRVAIKLVRTLGGERSSFLRRFETERQVLNSMNHPNIARLIDAAQLPEPDGRPYLVMEYVEGEHIDEYCDRMELSTGQRVAMFQKVCDAVQHAHQNLVVHRDIKPSNVLVDSRGEPKLMDFGIAKILNVSLAGLTMATGEGRGPMTPEYASPEQVLGKPVGTSSDVYALGVLLYQLLTGRRPYRAKNRSLNAMAKAIIEEEPDKPSTVVTHEEVRVAWDGTTTSIAADRLAKPREGSVHKLKRRLSGDLDNIILMAMRKSPQRRYPSAAALAEDLQRHLDGEPVKARGESWSYVAGKTLVRYRLPVGAAAAVLLATSVAAAYSWSAWRSERAALASERSAREAEARARADAEKRLEQVRELASNYLVDLSKRIEKLRGATEPLNLLSETSLKLLEKLAAEFPDDPGMKSSLSDGYALMGSALGGARGPGQGDTAAALDMMRRSLALRRELLTLNPSDIQAAARVAATLILEADYLLRDQRTSEARRSLDEAIELTSAAEAGVEARTRTLATALLDRSDLLRAIGDPIAADADLERSFAIRERLYNASRNDPRAERDYTVVLGRMADLAAARGDSRRAESLLRSSLELRERRHQRGPDARTERDLANAAGALGRFLTAQGGAGLAEAERLLNRALDEFRALERSDPSFARAQDDTLGAMIDLAALATVRADVQLALERWEAAATRARQLARSTPHPGDLVRTRVLARTLEQLAHAQDEAGEDPAPTLAEAIAAFERLPADAETTAHLSRLREAAAKSTR